jgi:hypothetical protein
MVPEYVLLKLAIFPDCVPAKVAMCESVFTGNVASFRWLQSGNIASFHKYFLSKQKSATFLLLTYLTALRGLKSIIIKKISKSRS